MKIKIDCRIMVSVCTCSFVFSFRVFGGIVGGGKREEWGGEGRVREEWGKGERGIKIDRDRNR